MRALRALVVDDERLARVGISRELEAIGGIEVVGACASGVEAVRAIRDAAPDVVLLDVRMPGMSGFDVVRDVGVEAMPAVVFVTAHDEHALRAFDVNAVDYVLKPVEPTRLREALRRVEERIDRDDDAPLGARLGSLLRRVEELEARTVDPESDPEADDPLERLAVEKGGQIRFVDVGDVRWIEAAGNYARLHTVYGDFLVRRTLKSLEEDLDASSFLRVRRSTIVNMARVRGIEPGDDRRYRIRLDDGTVLRSSRRRRGTVKSYVDRHR